MALLRGLKSGLERSALEGLQVPGDTGPTAFSGSLPDNIGELSGWTGTACWTLLYNFNAATLSPAACVKATGSTGNNLTKLGSASDTAKTTSGQSGYADQTGLTINSDQDFIYGNATTAWSFSPTVPTCYLLTFKFGATPSTYYTFFAGQDGTAGGGWSLSVSNTAGIRAGIGNGTSGFVQTAYVGGTSFFDGEYHTILLVIDDANGKAKLYSEFGNTESTGLTIGGGASFCTIGPSGAGGGWGAPVTYLVAARGEHPLLYDNAQALFNEYEDARLNGTHPAAITALPTTLAEVNSLTGIAFTHAWNVNSATPSPMTGSAGVAMAAETASIYNGSPGVAPTVSAAPQVRTSMTGQAAARFAAGGYANLKADLPLAHLPYALVVIYKQAPAATAKTILGRGQSSSPRGFLLNSPSNDRVTLYHRDSGLSVVTSSIAAPASSDNTWRVAAVSVKPTATALQAINDNGQTVAGATVLATSNATADQGYLGAQAVQVASGTTYTNGGNLDIALVAWVQSPGVQPDATALETAVNALRWRYGI